MFQYHREMERLDLPAGSVFQLQRSLNRIQVALSGFPPQEAEAYVVLFAAGQGVRAAVVLHLLTSERLAIYLKEPGPLAPARAQRLLDEGIAFAESMGYLLGDLDFPLLADAEKATLWEGLPLSGGLSGRQAAPAEVPTPGRAAAKPAAVAGKEAPAGKKTAPPQAPVPPVAPPERSTVTEPQQAVPAAPATSPPESAPDVPLPRSLKSQKRPPTPDEIAGKRQRLREALGKLFASL